MNETVYQAASLIIPLVIAIVFHEVAHGWAARALGDPTAAQMNRLSLNPFRHVDPIGTVVLPGFLALIKAPVFGWAKPVPVIKERLRNPRTGMMLVAAAGPGSNLVQALVGAILLGLLLTTSPQSAQLDQISVPGFLALNLFNYITINIFLALFNLLPVPPFDGSHIVEGFLPPKAAATYEKLRPIGFPLMLVLLVALPSVSPSLDIVTKLVVPPVRWLTEIYLNIAMAIAGR
jgi:Zn-dependent protease